MDPIRTGPVRISIRAESALGMALQAEADLTTAKAYDALGLVRDSRLYVAEVEALRDLGYKRIRLITANPRKIESLAQAGFDIIDVVQLRCELNPVSLQYVLSKQEELSHLRVYNSDGEEHELRDE